MTVIFWRECPPQYQFAKGPSRVLPWEQEVCWGSAGVLWQRLLVAMNDRWCNALHLHAAWKRAYFAELHNTVPVQSLCLLLHFNQLQLKSLTPLRTLFNFIILPFNGVPNSEGGTAVNELVSEPVEVTGVRFTATYNYLPSLPRFLMSWGLQLEAVQMREPGSAGRWHHSSGRAVIEHRAMP